jgi:UDP-GlcNAc:undecaprenyl-phosphate GlcNAc-1-phosphate transferase
LKKNIFLGDSGSLFLGCLIGLNIIFKYNLEILKSNYPVESIFIALMLPGLDMLRVFVIRIMNKKNPFLPDRRHLHHLLIDNKVQFEKILMIFFILILTPILINQFSNIMPLFIILIYIFLYCILIICLQKKFLKKKFVD